jgi:hypothetical protein
MHFVKERIFKLNIALAAATHEYPSLREFSSEVLKQISVICQELFYWFASHLPRFEETDIM